MTTRSPEHAKAQSWARQELVDRHYEEYRELYEFCKEVLGIKKERRDRPRTSARPPAPGREGS